MKKSFYVKFGFSLLILLSVFFWSSVCSPMDKITLQLKDMDIVDALKMLSEKGNLNIVAEKGVAGRITIFLTDVEVLEALDIICEVNNFAYVQDVNTIKVFTPQGYQALYGKKFHPKTQVKVFHLKHTDVNLVAKELAHLKSAEGRIISDTRNNTIIAMDTPEVLKDMALIVGSMDVPVETRSFTLTHTTPDVIQNCLKTVLTPAGKILTDPRTNKIMITDTKGKLSIAEQIIQEYDKPAGTVSREFCLKYTKVGDLVPAITSELTKGVGTLHSDQKTNKLLINDFPEPLARIEDIIDAFDKKTQEVLIEAKILQVSLNEETKLGVNWEAISKEIGDIGTISVQGTFNILANSDPGGRVVTGVLSEDGYHAVLEVLQSVAETELLASPRVTALNNEEARILVGSTVPYKTVDTREDGGVIKTFEKVTMVDVGVKLYVLPTINEDGFVTMKINPEVSSVVGFSEKIPIVEKAETETSVMVKDGVTIVIGGLIRSERMKDVHRIPILGSIPILGLLFRSTYTTLVKKEIVVFLTPHIITGDVTTEELEKIEE